MAWVHQVPWVEQPLDVLHQGVADRVRQASQLVGEFAADAVLGAEAAGERHRGVVDAAFDLQGEGLRVWQRCPEIAWKDQDVMHVAVTEVADDHDRRLGVAGAHHRLGGVDEVGHVGQPDRDDGVHAGPGQPVGV